MILQLLRFAAIGILNTALDFLVLNFISKTLGVTEGFKLGQINVVGFLLAMLQSYFWNRYWTFGAQDAGQLLRNFVRLIMVGVVGTIAFGLVLLGAKISAPGYFYLIILVIFGVSQLVLWNSFQLNTQVVEKETKGRFIAFFIVSLIGLVLNSAIVTYGSSAVVLTASADLNKNIAKIIATGASLVWNFIGYKLFVFKK